MAEHFDLSIILLNFLGIAGIIVWHLQGRTRPTERLVAQIAFFLAMTATLVFARVNPFRFDSPHMDGDGTLVVSAKILWWTHMAWATIGFVRIYIVLDGRPREARLIQDLLVAMVYLGALLSVMAFVFGVPIGTLLATSGVVAIILGLALQNTLGDVFSGIALTLGRPYVIGDWISLSDGTEGRIVASNWRSTYILTGMHNLVVLPNSVLAKQGLTNVSKPDENHQILLPVRIVPNTRPKFVVDILHEALNSCNGIVHEPPPTAALVGINGTAIEIELQFRVTGPAQRGLARNEVIDLIYQHCNSNGLMLAKPPGTQIFEGSDALERAHISVERLFDSAPLFAGLTAPERAVIAASSKRGEAAAGSTIVTKGEKVETLVLINTGIVTLNDDGEEITRLAPGDYLGARSVVSGEPEFHEAKALTRITFFQIDKLDFEKLILSRPSILDDLSCRMSEARAVQANSGEPIVSAQARADLIQTIRSAFGSH
ncbi:mechanosensitive ion channel family protein [Neorhizobium sp. T25_27]|uniref:mechanosensitive ion channel family protein n=1 Tax=Neorhizobium sp. T25_27 TaxID=2093831 RepID=UPI000CF91D2F|nr:mechanosensitive ion channel family protein [Neorhizobium sp. T25_27]